MNVDKAHSSLLSRITQPGHEDILFRILASGDLLKDTALETGIVIDPSMLHLDVLSDQFIQLRYQSTHRVSLEKALDTLALHFIDELIAPERFRTDQQLHTLESQIRDLLQQRQKAQTALDALTRKALPQTADARERNQQQRDLLRSRLERFDTQLKLSRKEYETLLVSAQAFAPQGQEGRMSGFLWFAEPTLVNDPLDRLERHIDVTLYAFYFGLFLGVLLTFWRRFTDRSLRRDEDIILLTGVRILGRIPALGRIRFDQGCIHVHTSTPTERSSS